MKFALIFTLFAVVAHGAFGTKLSEEELQRLNKRGLRHNQRQEFAKSIEVFTEMLSHDVPSNWRVAALYSRGLARKQWDMHDEAAQDFTDALAVKLSRKNTDKMHPLILSHLGSITCLRYQGNEGLDMILRAKEMAGEEKKDDLAVDESRCLMAQRRFEDAHALIQNLLEKPNLPSDIRNRALMARAMILFAQKDDEGFVVLDQVIDDPEAGSSFVFKAQCMRIENLLHRLRGEEAGQLIDQIEPMLEKREYAKEKVQALTCWIMSVMSDGDDARRCIDRVMQNNPAHTLPYFYALKAQSKLHYVEGNNQDRFKSETSTIRWLERQHLLTMDESLVHSFAERADASVNMGRIPLAKMDLKKALEVAESHGLTTDRADILVQMADLEPETSDARSKFLHEASQFLDDERAASISIRVYQALCANAFDLNQHESVIEYAQKYIAVAEKISLQSELWVGVSSMAARSMDTLGRFDEALKYLDMAVKNAEESNAIPKIELAHFHRYRAELMLKLIHSGALNKRQWCEKGLLACRTARRLSTDTTILQKCQKLDKDFRTIMKTQ